MSVIRPSVQRKKLLDSLAFYDANGFLEPQDNEIIQTLRDRWWVTDGEGNIAFSVERDGRTERRYPLCNADKRLAMRFAKQYGYSEDSVLLVPLVYLEVNISDYAS